METTARTVPELTEWLVNMPDGVELYLGTQDQASGAGAKAEAGHNPWSIKARLNGIEPNQVRDKKDVALSNGAVRNSQLNKI